MRLPLLLAALSLVACGRPKPKPSLVDASSQVAPTASSVPIAASTELAKGSNEFGFDLYGRVSATPGNVAISPASISAALAMTYGGAKGETAAQMKKTLHFASEPAPTMAAWGASLGAMKLRVANRLYGEKTYHFEPAFVDRTKTAFNAPLEAVDFHHAPEPARVHINGWVEEQTEHRIKELLPPKAIDADTRLVLVNAIYFLAGWETPFDESRTTNLPFHLTASTTKKVMTMVRAGVVGFATGDGARMVELNYKGGSSALWVVLPDAVDGLPGVEKSLTAARLEQWKQKLAPAHVFLELPRFEVSPKESLALESHLQAMGMPDAFDRAKANFTTIANPPKAEDRLHIAHVFHKAFVKTDEKGTEAAAATAVSMGKGGGSPPDEVEFNVDHPFLFFIVDKPSGLVLFMGRVSDPESM